MKLIPYYSCCFIICLKQNCKYKKKIINKKTNKNKVKLSDILQCNLQIAVNYYLLLCKGIII